MPYDISTRTFVDEADLLEGIRTSAVYPRIQGFTTNPMPMRSELIWASPREILNTVQAGQVGCHIITLTHDPLKKLDGLGKKPEQYSLEAVRMSHGDARRAGFTL